jgi:hypothetical protein
MKSKVIHLLSLGYLQLCNGPSLSLLKNETQTWVRVLSLEGNLRSQTELVNNVRHSEDPLSTGCNLSRSPLAQLMLSLPEDSLANMYIVPLLNFLARSWEGKHLFTDF